MCILIYLFVSSIVNAAREDFPDKEPRIRCNNQKVSSCIEENAAHMQYLENQIVALHSQKFQIQQDLEQSSAQKLLLEQEYQRYFSSYNFLLSQATIKNAERKLEKWKIFVDGPTPLELKMFAQFGLPPEETDETAWNYTLQQDLEQFQRKMTFFTAEISSLSNNFNAMTANLAQFTQEISAKEMQKKQHAAMCNGGCKSRFCPES